MNAPFKRLGADATYPGMTTVTWMAGLVNVASGDIIEIRWGVAGTRFDQGKVSTGTVADIVVSEGTSSWGRFKRAEVVLWRGWHEQTVQTVVHDGGLMFVPDVVEMLFPHTFDLRTDDTEDGAWTIVIRGHDCSAHAEQPCTSQWLSMAEKYLKAAPEVVAPQE